MLHIFYDTKNGIKCQDPVKHGLFKVFQDSINRGEVPLFIFGLGRGAHGVERLYDLKIGQAGIAKSHYFFDNFLFGTIFYSFPCSPLPPEGSSLIMSNTIILSKWNLMLPKIGPNRLSRYSVYFRNLIRRKIFDQILLNQKLLPRS